MKIQNHTHLLHQDKDKKFKEEDCINFEITNEEQFPSVVQETAKLQEIHTGEIAYFKITNKEQFPNLWCKKLQNYKTQVVVAEKAFETLKSRPYSMQPLVYQEKYASSNTFPSFS